MLALDKAIASARKKAVSKGTTVYVHRNSDGACTTDLIGTRDGRPAAARVNKHGIDEYWAASFGHYVTVPERTEPMRRRQNR